jgi:ketosteroid isomerase-like protein
MTVTSTTILPSVLHQYLTAISAGDLDGALRHTSPDVASALPPAGDHVETSARRQTVGRQALRDALPGSFGDGAVTVLMAASAAEHWLLEGRVESDPAETLVASFTVRDDLITRQLVFRCQLVGQPPAARARAEHDGLAAVERYFEHLEAGDMAAAAECFSPDTVYSHPPYKHAPEEGRAEFRGRAELLAGFERRGFRTVHHELLVGAQHGTHFLVEGRTDDAPDGASFLSSVTLDGEGRIDRYVALMTQPQVPFGDR